MSDRDSEAARIARARLPDGLVLRDTAGVLQRAPAAWGVDKGLSWPYRAPDGALWITTENTALFCGHGDIEVTAPVAVSAFITMFKKTLGKTPARYFADKAQEPTDKKPRHFD